MEIQQVRHSARGSGHVVCRLRGTAWRNQCPVSIKYQGFRNGTRLNASPSPFPYILIIGLTQHNVFNMQAVGNPDKSGTGPVNAIASPNAHLNGFSIAGNHTRNSGR